MTSGLPWSRTTTIALAFAVAWSALLVAAAIVLPAYGTATKPASVDSSAGSTTTTATTGAATLVGVNGSGVLIIVSIPLAVSLLVALALAGRRRRVGWVLTALLGFFNLLAMLSIGIFILPTTLALVVACAGTERRRIAHPADDTAPVTA